MSLWRAPNCNHVFLIYTYCAAQSISVWCIFIHKGFKQIFLWVVHASNPSIILWGSCRLWPFFWGYLIRVWFCFVTFCKMPNILWGHAKMCGCDWTPLFWFWHKRCIDLGFTVCTNILIGIIHPTCVYLKLLKEGENIHLYMGEQVWSQTPICQHDHKLSLRYIYICFLK